MAKRKAHAPSGMVGITRCGRGTNRAHIVYDAKSVTCMHCVSRMSPEMLEERNRPARMVERVNLMSGVKYMEPEDTPNYLSPASEAYWSM